MKRITFIFAIVFSVLVTGCDLFSSSSNSPYFKYRFKTAKDHYTADSTTTNPVHVKATFTNQSNQTLYLRYQGCMLIGLERLQASKWKTVPIPILCTAIVRGPVRVESGQEAHVGISLGWWGKLVGSLQSGVYRFTLSVRSSSHKQSVEITSNRFTISY